LLVNYPAEDETMGHRIGSTIMGCGAVLIGCLAIVGLAFIVTCLTAPADVSFKELVEAWGFLFEMLG
jgi:hypothetical protein